MPDMHRLPHDTPIGWLSGEHMNSWMELLIRRRAADGTLDGTTRPCLCTIPITTLRPTIRKHLSTIHWTLHRIISNVLGRGKHGLL
ncbi:hypothetical protein Tco_0063339 [Tanacetum coccineum]